jgi:hypothetical protein
MLPPFQGQRISQAKKQREALSKQSVPLKHRLISTTVHAATTQKMSLSLIVARLRQNCTVMRPEAFTADKFILKSSLATSRVNWLKRSTFQRDDP